MKALVYHGTGEKAWESAEDPAIEDPTDVIVKVDTTTICGTDLHILKGDVPAVTDGRILGHEAVGTVVETGSAVSSLAEGDRVLVPAITSCGRCSYCKLGIPAHCEAVGGIGWIFGHLVDGVQAELARVPFAETSVHMVPEGLTDKQVIFLADILPTGYEIGVQNGRMKPGDSVAVVGAGPVGLAAIMTAALAGAGRIIAIDLAPSRLAQAKEFGATHAIESGEDVERQVLELTDGMGVNVAMEAVGIPATFDLCRAWCVPVGSWPTSASTERRRPCTSRSSGSRTSRSPPGLSAGRRCPRCSSSCATDGSRLRSSAPTTSSSATSCRPTTSSAPPASTTRSRWS